MTTIPEETAVEISESESGRVSPTVYESDQIMIEDNLESDAGESIYGGETETEADAEDLDEDIEEVDKTDVLSTTDTEVMIEKDVYVEDAEHIPVKYYKNVIVIKPENRKSSNILTNFEICEIISIRSQQISKDDKTLIEKGILDDPISIAKKELMERKCPLVLRRKIGEIYDDKKNILNEYYEFWDVNKMTFPRHYDV